MAKIAQEFYCNGCDGYIRLKLNMALNHKIIVVCPGVDKKGVKCTERHIRVIKDGVIYEHHPASTSSSYSEEIVPPRSAYSKKSILVQKDARNAATLPDNAAPMLRELWVERFGARI